MGAQQTKGFNQHDKGKHVYEEWDAKEDLLSIQQSENNDNDEEKKEYICLYDFEGSSESHLKIKKGDRVELSANDEKGEWSLVLKEDNKKGWVPRSYIAPIYSLQKFSWYHGPISRSTAEYLLRSGICGCFLVRESESSTCQWSISLRFQGEVHHYRIRNDSEGQVFIKEDSKFPSLPFLIHHLSQNADGLVTCLQFPVVRRNKPSIYSNSPTASSDHWEVDRSELELEEKLGSGQYGDVYKGIWLTWKRKIAVKTLKTESSDSEGFLKEIAVMKEIKHPNLLQLLGVCSKEAPFYIITEFMSQGSLLDYLQSANFNDLTHTTLLYMASQIVSGMVYLEKLKFIHRDLAARNCLVAEDHVVKVADFGLARFVMEEAYMAQAGTKFPIKWTAPESLAYSFFTTKSDVWAFGVLLYELVTLGKTPYPDIPISDLFAFLQKGGRMNKPESCPQAVYEIMLQCWRWKPDERPSFKQLQQILENLHLKEENTNKKTKQEKKNNFTTDENNNNIISKPAPLPKNKSDRPKNTKPRDPPEKPKVLVSNLNNKIDENLKKKIMDKKESNINDNINQKINNLSKNLLPVQPKKPTPKSSPSTSPSIKPTRQSPFKPKADPKPAVKIAPVPKFKPKSTLTDTVPNDKKSNFKDQIIVGNVANIRERFSKNLPLVKPPITSPKPVIAFRPNTANLPRKPLKTTSPTPPIKPKISS